MKEEPTVTQVRLMEEFNLTRKQVQKIIKDLRGEGLVERQGSNRSGKWMVKSSVIAMLEPHTAAELNIDDIKAMCDELIEAQGNYMSMYKIKR